MNASQIIFKRIPAIGKVTNFIRDKKSQIHILSMNEMRRNDVQSELLQLVLKKTYLLNHRFQLYVASFSIPAKVDRDYNLMV
ncbi:hypothetical protein SAE01_46990 [Segetibacter aerophilus]|uniref:Uncharacterized protein n=1 Tax=Segetibacter aerophilus TaxID=670293 RepID=A0A512BJQ7_9BACT|nr:hypothetical protein SAE01_46990 [Segetibacter aerophilus]